MSRGNLHTHTQKEKVVIILLALVILFLLRGVWMLFVKHRVAIEERDTVAENLAQAKKRYADLSDEVKNLETERGVEASIREKFHVAKPGEKTVVLVTPSSTAKTVENPSFWDTIKSFFFK